MKLWGKFKIQGDFLSRKCKKSENLKKQAHKPRSYASLKLCRPTESVAVVKCSGATSAAKKGRFEVSVMMGRWAGIGAVEGSRGTAQSRPACLALIHTPQSTHPSICHRKPMINSNHSTISISFPFIRNHLHKYFGLIDGECPAHTPVFCTYTYTPSGLQM